MAAGNLVPRVLRVHVSLDAARSDGVDGDVLVAGVGGKAAGEGLDGSFGACVERVVLDSRHGRGDRGGQNDAAVV